MTWLQVWVDQICKIFNFSEVVLLNQLIKLIFNKRKNYAEILCNLQQKFRNWRFFWESYRSLFFLLSFFWFKCGNYLKGIEKLLFAWFLEKYIFMQESISRLCVRFFFILSAMNLKAFLMQYLTISYFVFLVFLNFLTMMVIISE